MLAMFQSRRYANPVKAITRLYPLFKRHTSTTYSDTLESDDDNDSDDGDGEVPTQKEHNTTYKFMDRAQIEVCGGRGGNGCVSFEVLTPGKKRPTGGNGGRGGDVYVVADRGLNGMSFTTFHFNAGHGKNGGSEGLTGKRGADVYIRVPLGTVVTERLSDNLQNFIDEDGGWEEEIDFPSIDLDTHNATILLAEGGIPGMGNGQMAGTSTSRKKSTPATKMPGQAGGRKSVLLELKLIADVGLVGYPNAGKSTLLKALSNARPKIAAYPFTTLHPNIGVVEYSDLERVTIADIPGLVDGASENKGLGHDFLRHIERTKIILYVIDGAGGDNGGSGGIEPAAHLKSLWKELKLYDAELVKKPSMIFVNKSDLQMGAESMKKLLALAEKLKLTVHFGSADKGAGVGLIANKMRGMVEKLRVEQAQKLAEKSEKVEEKEKENKNPELKVKIKPADEPKKRVKRTRPTRETNDGGKDHVQAAQIVDTTDPFHIDADVK